MMNSKREENGKNGKKEILSDSLQLYLRIITSLKLLPSAPLINYLILIVFQSPPCNSFQLSTFFSACVELKKLSFTHLLYLVK